MSLFAYGMKRKNAVCRGGDATPYHVWLSGDYAPADKNRSGKSILGPVYKVSAGYSFSGSSFGGRTSEIVGRTWY